MIHIVPDILGSYPENHHLRNKLLPLKEAGIENLSKTSAQLDEDHIVNIGRNGVAIDHLDNLPSKVFEFPKNTPKDLFDKCEMCPRGVHDGTFRMLIGYNGTEVEKKDDVFANGQLYELVVTLEGLSIKKLCDYKYQSDFYQKWKNDNTFEIQIPKKIDESRENEGFLYDFETGSFTQFEEVGFGV